MVAMNRVALIFDLDGTLWDAALPVSEIWTEEGKKRFGPDYFLGEADVRAEMGKTMDQIVSEVAPKLKTKEERDAFAQLFLDSETVYLKDHPGRLFPKEIETLLLLREWGYPLYIVSNCQKGYIENFIPLLPEGTISDFLCWGDTHGKKHETILALMKKNQVEKAIYIGDTRGDEIETHEANLPFIHADYGYGVCLRPEGRITSFEELPQIVKQLEAEYDNRSYQEEKE